ncbi:MAG: hypothetical protein ABSE47_06820, partial [Acidimicrobiales bacterium]
TSPSRCIAVGDYTNSGGREVTLAEAWNGSSWKIQTTRNPTGAQSAGLSGVSCTAATCTAVGNYVSSGGTELTLVEVWNGTGWTIRPTADPADAQAARLSAVSCTRASSCIAVGSYIITDSSGKEVTLAEVWNGANWKIEATPNPTDTEIDLLSGVSCTATSACIAVGSADGGRLAEVLKGTSWKLQAIPSPAGAQASSLSGISCSAVSACITVGNYTNIGGVELTLAEVWNGADWKVQPSLDPGGAPQSYLSGVSCFRASVCTAVGGYNPVDNTVGVTLAEGYF